MKDRKEKLERRIIRTIRLIKRSPMNDKVRYSAKLETYYKQYETLTGQAYRIETQGNGE